MEKQVVRAIKPAKNGRGERQDKREEKRERES